MKHSDPLFKYNVATSVAFNNWLVAHIEGSHHLEHRDFNWEVERSDHRDGTVWEPVASIKLTGMIARLALAMG
jgi:hypothetical protein